MGIIPELLTAGVAVLAITLAVAQYVTAHRPYVSVTRLHIGIEQPTRDLGLEIEITNLGRIPAKKVTVKVVQIGGDGSTVLFEEDRPIGVVFPGQTVTAGFAANFANVEQHDAGEVFHVTILYEGPLALGGRKHLAYGRYFTFQPLYVDRGGWAAAYNRAADFR